jgi:type VI protein secretion system component Hcp
MAMKSLTAVLSAALLAVATPAMADQLIVSTGGTVTCAPQVSVTQGSTTTMVTGFTPQSYSIGGTEAVTIGSPVTITPPALNNLKLTKVFDACSQPLISALMTPAPIPTLTLMQLRSLPNGTNFPVLTITLTNAYVTSWSTSSESPGTAVQDTFTFGYKSICIANTTLTTTGAVGTTTSHCYDLVLRSAV